VAVASSPPVIHFIRFSGSGADEAGMNVSVIIINWNSREYLKECLQSLIRHTKEITYEILVLDNASFDGSAEMIAAEYPQVNFIQVRKNLGFAAGNNLAARRATGEMLLFLNPDTALQCDALSFLYQALKADQQAGVAGARLLNSDRTVQTSCIQAFPTVLNSFIDSDFLRKLFPRAAIWGMKPLFSTSNEPSQVDAVSGACLMIRRSLFDMLNGFDERYFMYTEDRDLCYRAYVSGCARLHVPSAVVVHHGGGSSRNNPKLLPYLRVRRSIYRFMRLRKGRITATLFRCSQGLSAFYRLILLVLAFIILGRGSSGRDLSIAKWVGVLCWALSIDI
jgi:N-acetylglucosaminyl-diphospho-decaprenol L-rhamnosyltransferase